MMAAMRRVVPATASPQHRAVSWSRTVAIYFDFALVMECVWGVALDVLAVSPPHGLDCRQFCKIIKNFRCELVYLRSKAPQVVHCTPKIPMPLLRPLRVGASMSSCETLGWTCAYKKDETLRRHIGVAIP